MPKMKRITLERIWRGTASRDSSGRASVYSIRVFCVGPGQPDGGRKKMQAYWEDLALRRLALGTVVDLERLGGGWRKAASEYEFSSALEDTMSTE
jgi:hypothetical protein